MTPCAGKPHGADGPTPLVLSGRPAYVAADFPGKCKCFPERDTLLLPFQAKWARDNSRLKIAEKSRQIGWTWSTAYRLVSQKSLVDARLVPKMVVPVAPAKVVMLIVL